MNRNEWLAPLLLGPLFPVFFVALWVLALRMIALFGWSRLVSRYQADGEPASDAERLYWRSMGIGSFPFVVGYGNCVNVWIEGQGLYLRPSLPFRLFHPMLRLPWQDMRSVEDGGWFLFRRTRLQMDGDVPPITLHGGLASAVRKFWDQRVPSRR